MKIRTAFFSVLFLFITNINIQAQGIDINKRLQGFDQYMEKILNDWNAPGVGVGIVYRDKLVFAKGYGYRDYEKKLPITENTLYQNGREMPGEKIK